MFNNAEDHLQGKFWLQQLNFAGGGASFPNFFASSPNLQLPFPPVFSGHSCNLYPRFFYIAIWIFCKILISDTAAADLLAGTTQEDVKNVEEAKKGNLAWATMNTLPEADPARPHCRCENAPSPLSHTHTLVRERTKLLLHFVSWSNA